jgi:DNA-binding PadR family transcriptional regulator
MEFCILGLLLLKPQSIYQLNLAFQNSLSLFYQASLGAISIAVKKLLAQKLIKIHSQQNEGRKTKVYRVTPKGRSHFFEQYKQPLPQGKFEQTILARVFFLGLVLQNESRLIVLRSLNEAVNQAMKKLQSVQQSLEQFTVAPDLLTIFKYQQSTLVYGINSYQLALDWLSALLKEEEGSNQAL